MKKRIILASVAAAMLLTACYVGPAYGPRGGAVVIAPALPSLVILEGGPYYRHGGYFYYYDADVWYYSNHERGPWHKLPHDRWPRKTEKKGWGHDHDRDHDRDRDRDHDRRDDDRWRR